MPRSKDYGIVNLDGLQGLARLLAELPERSLASLLELARRIAADERADHATILGELQSSYTQSGTGLSTKRLAEHIGMPYSRVARRLDWLLGRMYVERSERNSTGPEFEWTVSTDGARYLGALVALEREEIQERQRRHSRWAAAFD
jgi:hypothetical protein